MAATAMTMLCTAPLRAADVPAHVALGWLHTRVGHGYHAWIVGEEEGYGLFMLEPQGGHLYWGRGPANYVAEYVLGPEFCRRVPPHVM